MSLKENLMKTIKKVNKVIKESLKMKKLSKKLFLNLSIALLTTSFFSCQMTIEPDQPPLPRGSVFLATSSDTGESDSDGITRDNTPSFEGSSLR